MHSAHVIVCCPTTDQLNQLLSRRAFMNGLTCGVLAAMMSLSPLDERQSIMMNGFRTHPLYNVCSRILEQRVTARENVAVVGSAVIGRGENSAIGLMPDSREMKLIFSTSTTLHRISRSQELDHSLRHVFGRRWQA